MTLGIYDRLTRAYNQKDDVAFDAVTQELLNEGAFLPPDLEKHVSQWLKSNEKIGPEVRWGRFPLGMVARLIERVEEIEHRK